MTAVPHTIRMHPADNVAIVANDGGLDAGTALVWYGVTIFQFRVPFLDVLVFHLFTQYVGKLGDAAFNGPQGMALIKDMLYVADRGNHCVRRIHMITGEVDTMAGSGVHGRPATQDYPEPRQVALNSPWALAAAGEKLLIAMAGQHQIWSLDLSRKRLNLYSGTGKIGRDDGDGLFATFAKPKTVVRHFIKHTNEIHYIYYDFFFNYNIRL